MKTTGVTLKSNLKLNKFENVKIRRLVTGGSIRIYQVAFDSRHPLMPLTTYTLFNNILVPRILMGNGRRYFGTPWANIENFNGNLNPAIFFVTDISGVYGNKSLYKESKNEFKPFVECSGYLLEFVTLAAFKDSNIISNITQTYKDIRKGTGQVKVQGRTVANTANVNTKLITTELVDNDVVFKFLTEATEMYGPNHKFIQINPTTKEKEPNPSKTYEIWIKLLNVVGEKGWLSAFDTEKEVLTQKDIKDIFDVCNVQLWSNDPSFQYQGFNYWNTQLDASIFPEDRAPRFWNKKHGDGQAFLTKHLSQLIDQLPFFRNQMASALTSVLKTNGYL